LNEPVFDKLFRQAELAQLTPDQDLDYERSMKVYLDTVNQIKGARILGREDGLAEGKALGLAEGKKLGLAEGKELGLAEGKELGLAEGKELGLAEGVMKAKRETARKMLDMGIDPETISQATGLSKEEIPTAHG
ncbi:MAG: hypothetical protein J6X40_06140, partial [Bacteroidales bacterium]|nr:hypothetical protein [Bacteroidales bacterium]